MHPAWVNSEGSMNPVRPRPHEETLPKLFADIQGLSAVLINAVQGLGMNAQPEAYSASNKATIKMPAEIAIIAFRIDY